MTTEIQTLVTPPKNSENFSSKLTKRLEEKKGNATKPLSLRPNRSIKKNTSLKPLGLKLR